MNRQQNQLSSASDGNNGQDARGSKYTYYGSLSGPDTQGTLMRPRAMENKCGCGGNKMRNDMPQGARRYNNNSNAQQFQNKPPMPATKPQPYVNRLPQTVMQPSQTQNASPKPYPNNAANYPPYPPQASQK